MFRTMRVNMSTNHPALLGLANATDFALDAGVSDDQVAYQTDDHFTDDMLGRDDHTRWGDDAADDDPHHDTYSHRYAGAYTGSGFEMQFTFVPTLSMYWDAHEEFWKGIWGLLRARIDGEVEGMLTLDPSGSLDFDIGSLRILDIDLSLGWIPAFVIDFPITFTIEPTASITAFTPSLTTLTVTGSVVYIVQYQSTTGWFSWQDRSLSFKALSSADLKLDVALGLILTPAFGISAAAGVAEITLEAPFTFELQFIYDVNTESYCTIYGISYMVVGTGDLEWASSGYQDTLVYPTTIFSEAFPPGYACSTATRQLN
eukprot:m.515040 g.515040  ORF g.515040 m.515040 type:complete len:315 (+) comp57459_c0_seq8:1000-1944(+)